MNNNSLSVNIDLQIGDSGELEVSLEILNALDRDLPDWIVHFDLPKSIAAGHNTCILSQAGSHIAARVQDNALLARGQCGTVRFRGQQAIIRRLTDLPDGVYLESRGEFFPANLGEQNLSRLTITEALPEYGGIPGSSYAPCATITPSATGTFATTEADAGPILPRPATIQFSEGHFTCADVLSVSRHPEATDALTWLTAMLPSGLRTSDADLSESALQFVQDISLATEAYRLSIAEDKIVVAASDAGGFFYAVVSLVQLFPLDARSTLTLPCTKIEDCPRFGYRGVMLDCARHFHSKKVIFSLLDLMVLYKLNRFHWHLTDDEGWRLEIKAFPALTQVGAWRGAEEVLEPQFGSGPNRYGGYYSRKDVREIVEYAERRQILVIPEIDIPGHSRAAIKSLPELLVEPQNKSQYCSAQLYNDNVLNPALPGTYQFLHAVLDEVCELFPGPYVHIGADEVPAGVWDESPACDAMKKKYGYHNALDLQGHLLRNLQAYLKEKDRQLIGWEEAAHGDKLDHAAIICAWSGVASANDTANTGYRVIACPAPFAYMDLAWDSNMNEPGFHWAGTATLETCYAYEPDTGAISDSAKQQILGLQAVAWSELLASPERLEYMLFPRVLAIAETAWSPRCSKDWDNFQKRVNHQMAVLDQRGINHRPVDILQ